MLDIQKLFLQSIPIVNFEEEHEIQIGQGFFEQCL